MPILVPWSLTPLCRSYGIWFTVDDLIRVILESDVLVSHWESRVLEFLAPWPAQLAHAGLTGRLFEGGVRAQRPDLSCCISLWKALTVSVLVAVTVSHLPAASSASILSVLLPGLQLSVLQSPRLGGGGGGPALLRP